LVFHSKMRKNGGSMITVVPSGIVNLLGFETGDELNWIVNITEDSATITLEKKSD